MNGFDTWTQIIGSLAGQRTGWEPSLRVTKKQRAAQIASPPAGGRCASVVALEMTGDCTLLISWSDATRGRYAYQRWVIGTSRGKGYCALSGCLIRRGDQVYRPQWRGEYCPANGADMILAAALPRMAICEADPEDVEEALQ